MQEKFLSKTGRAIKLIASDLILMNSNESMPIISEFQKKHGMSRGTVQNALNYLKEEKVIETISKGCQGTILQYIDYTKLQKIVISGTIRGTMPLPYSKLYEGFATGMYEAFQEAKISLSMAYVRGSKERMGLILEDSIQFAIVSKLAFINADKKDKELEIIKDFGLGSYLSKHVIIFSNSKSSNIEDGMRVGIDHNSYDQQILTECATRNKKIKFIEIPSHQLIYALEQGKIDAGIWNYDEIKDKKMNHLNYIFLEESKEDKLASTAVCVIKRGNLVLKKILKQIIENKDIVAVQKEVVSGKIIPHY